MIRPDLILTDDGFVATELDSIPGGMGFVGAMAEAYCGLGIERVGGADGMPIGFAAMLRHVTRDERPTVAIVVSESRPITATRWRGSRDAMRRLDLADACAAPPKRSSSPKKASSSGTRTAAK